MELIVGQTASLTKAFSKQEVGTFATLSHDTNPIHLSDLAAENSIFGKRIVHGFLSGSLISAVTGTQLSGEGAIYLH